MLVDKSSDPGVVDEHLSSSSNMDYRDSLSVVQRATRDIVAYAPSVPALPPCTRDCSPARCRLLGGTRRVI